MRFVRTAVIAGIATATLAGAAFAAGREARTMLVAHADGTVEHIPVEQVQVVAVPVAPAAMFEAAFGPNSMFAEMDRMAAAMEAQSAAMMRRAATMQTAGGKGGGGGIVMTNAQGQPVGVMQYSFVSSSTDAQGCTRTISYSSDGAQPSSQPKPIRTSAGNCGAEASPAPAIAPAAPRAPARVTPTRAKPAARPAPKIIPVSAQKPEEIFTPSRT